MKASQLTEAEKLHYLDTKQPLPVKKLFQIPDEYLPLQMRSVQKGKDGLTERLRRDMIEAKRIQRNSINKDESKISIIEESTFSKQKEHQSSRKAMQSQKLLIDQRKFSRYQQNVCTENHLQLPQISNKNSTLQPRNILMQAGCNAKNESTILDHSSSKLQDNYESQKTQLLSYKDRSKFLKTKSTMQLQLISSLKKFQDEDHYSRLESNRSQRIFKKLENHKKLDLNRTHLHSSQYSTTQPAQYNPITKSVQESISLNKSSSLPHISKDSVKAKDQLMEMCKNIAGQTYMGLNRTLTSTNMSTRTKTPPKQDTFMSLGNKMDLQKKQIGLVRDFAQRVIEDQQQLRAILKSLEILDQTLDRQGLTLSEIVEQFMNNLLAKANFQSEEQNKTKVDQNQYKIQSKSSQGFDFVRIIKSTSCMQPLLRFQQQLNSQIKRGLQSQYAGSQERNKNSNSEMTTKSLAQNEEFLLPYTSNEQSILDFIQQVKRLFYLNAKDKMTKISDISCEGDASDFEWVMEPDIYQSSSSDSKYSNQDEEEKDHLAVGENALLNAMAKYKNADKIIQIHEMKQKSHQTSHLVHYFNELNKNGHIPKGFGFVHRKHDADSIDGSNCQITDQHAKAIALSLKKAKYVNRLILRNTGMTDEQGISIISAIDKSLIRHVDFSYNPNLTKKFYCKLADIIEEGCIERLEIEGNKVRDSVLQHLLVAMTCKKTIVYLNVSRNQISDTGARSIANLIRVCIKLRLLFLNYNRIMGQGANEIALALGHSSNLQVFDISWNSICGSGIIQKNEEPTDQSKSKQKKKIDNHEISAAPFQARMGGTETVARGFSQLWSDALAQNKSLLHVDLSHNHLDQADVQIISEGLKENQQILGIHFAGNEGDIDNQGFVKANKPLLVVAGSIMSRIPMQEEISVGVVRNSHALELAQNSKCWICEGWTEHRFTYEPGLSDDNPNHDGTKPIKLHLEIDKFEGDLMVRANTFDQVYELYRMLPPGAHRYYFSIDEKSVLAKEQLRTNQKAVVEQKKYLNLSKRTAKDQKSSQEPQSNKSSLKNTQAISPKLAEVKCDRQLVRREFQQSYSQLRLPEVNYIENIYQTRTLKSKQQLDDLKRNKKHNPLRHKFHSIPKLDALIGNMNCVPRPGPKNLGNRAKEQKLWDFSRSVFASYKTDSPSLLNECFETDWKRTKIDKMIKNQEEREELKKYFRSVYRYFREVYKYMSGQDPMGDISCIGANVLSEMIISGMPGLVDGKFLKTSDIDLERIKTNANEKNTKYNPKNNLVRHNFLEFFVRLCDIKYLKNEAAGSSVNTMPQAFKYMFENHCSSYFSTYDTHKWRENVLWCEDIDLVLKLSLDPLRAIYKKYIGKNALPGTQQFMSLGEFSECIINSNCLGDSFGAKQIGVIYNLSMMTQVDEIQKDKHLNMSFIEFLEAIVRVADKIDIPHCVIDEFKWGVDEIIPDMRETYAKRETVCKLESLILFLTQSNLSNTAYQKYVNILEEQRNSKLHANDFDAGILKINSKRK